MCTGCSVAEPQSRGRRVPILHLKILLWPGSKRLTLWLVCQHIENGKYYECIFSHTIVHYVEMYIHCCIIICNYVIMWPGSK